MRALSLIFFVAGLLLGLGGFLHSLKPSVMPLITVVGSFVLPALFFWWAWICHKKADAKR